MKDMHAKSDIPASLITRLIAIGDGNMLLGEQCYSNRGGSLWIGNAKSDYSKYA